MQVYGPSNLHGVQAIRPQHSTRIDAPHSTTGSRAASDSLEISTAGQLVDRARDLPAIRRERVESLRAQIADGTYETPERLSAALDRLLDEIG